MYCGGPLSVAAITETPMSFVELLAGDCREPETQRSDALAYGIAVCAASGDHEIEHQRRRALTSGDIRRQRAHVTATTIARVFVLVAADWRKER
jgi:hypothetical protein